MSSAEAWLLARRWIWLAIVGLVAGAAVAYGLADQQPRVYAASTRLLVTAGDSGVLSGGGNLTPDQILTTYAQVLQSSSVVEAAFAAVGVSATYDEAVRTLDVTPVRGTQIIVVTVRSGDPDTAARLANQLVVEAIQQARGAQARQLAASRAQLTVAASQLATQVETRVQQLEQQRSGSPSQATAVTAADAAATQAALADAELRYAAAVRSVSEQELGATRIGDPLSTVEPALPPTTPSYPRTALNVVLGAVVGLVAALAAATMLELLRDRLSTPEAVRRRTGLPVWSVVPPTPAAGAGVTEAFRLLRTSLQRILGERLATVLVTSSRPGEGTSTVAVGLARAWAHAGERVVLVDANVDAPTLASLLGVQSTPAAGGLLDTEPTRAGVANALGATGLAGLQLLTLTSNLEAAHDLLASRRMIRVIDHVRTLADRIVIDGPPMQAGETLDIAQWADAVVLVVNGRRSRSREVQRSASALRTGQVAILGTVLNHAA